MKAKTILPLLLFALFVDFGRAQDDALLDKEITQFAEQIATQVQKAGIKKVAVLDLTDLQDNTLELGKYIAEQATVDLVSTSRGFAVVDRTHLNSILAEHKLTISGLVQPENAKKLGQFSGVDAIVLGTITPLSETIKITAKIISTETADVLGAAKGQITKSPGVEKLLGKASEITRKKTGDSKGDPGDPPPISVKPIERDSQQVDDLLVKVESLKYSTDGVHGFVRVTMILQNTSHTRTIGVELYSRSNAFANSKLLNDRGEEFILRGPDVVGIPMASHPHYFADIQPGDRIVASLKYSVQWHDKKPGNWGPYRLEAEIMLGVEDKGQYTDVKTHNVVLDLGRAQ